MGAIYQLINKCLREEAVDQQEEAINQQVLTGGSKRWTNDLR
jgi:hypothetical protein